MVTKIAEDFRTTFIHCIQNVVYCCSVHYIRWKLYRFDGNSCFFQIFPLGQLYTVNTVFFIYYLLDITLLILKHPWITVGYTVALRGCAQRGQGVHHWRYQKETNYTKERQGIL
jgi:hypothetical protein